MSTLYTDNIRANNASQITVPTGQKIVGTDAASIYSPGSVVQCVHNTFDAHTSINSGVAKFIDYSITTKLANSFIMAQVYYSTSHPASYSDVDHAFALGWKTGSTSNSNADYTDTGGYGFSRQTVGGGMAAFLAADTHPAGTNGTQYWPFIAGVQRQISPSAAAGTEINVALWASSAGGTIHLGKIAGNSYTDSGAQSSITLWEIAQ